MGEYVSRRGSRSLRYGLENLDETWMSRLACCGDISALRSAVTRFR